MYLSFNDSVILIIGLLDCLLLACVLLMLHSKLGYSLARIYILQADPSFQDLVAAYRKDVHDAFVSAEEERYQIATSVNLKALRHINEHFDKADEEGELGGDCLVRLQCLRIRAIVWGFPRSPSTSMSTSTSPRTSSVPEPVPQTLGL